MSLSICEENIKKLTLIINQGKHSSSLMKFLLLTPSFRFSSAYRYNNKTFKELGDDLSQLYPSKVNYSEYGMFGN